MNEAETSEKAGSSEKAEKVVQIVEPEPESLATVQWKTIRFIELFFALGCMSSLLVLFIMNPILDDYMRFCKQLVKPGWVQLTTIITTNARTTASAAVSATVYPSNDSVIRDLGNEEFVVRGMRRVEASTPKTHTDAAGLKTFFFKLSYAIILFSLTTTILLVLFLDHISRFFEEPINKLPIILLLATSEVLSLIIMVLSLDIFLGAANGLVLAVAGLALGLSICFAADIVCTSIKGNG